MAAPSTARLYRSYPTILRVINLLPRPYISDTLRKKVTEDAQHRCGYCLTSQLITAMPMHVEHIIPLAAGGTSEEENLWLACPLCNGSKGTQMHATDSETRKNVSLFGVVKVKKGFLVNCYI